MVLKFCCVVESLGKLLKTPAIQFYSMVINEKSATAAAKSLQSCPTLCDPIDGSPRGSPVPGILQARILERGAIAFSACSLGSEIKTMM